jgi:hypothetical protein
VSQQPHHSPQGPRRPATVLVAALLGLALSACGNGSTTSTAGGAAGGGESTTRAPSATGGPPSPAPSASGGTDSGRFLEVMRSGGIAGVRDLVRVAADGTATVVTRDGSSRSCRPAAADVRRLRQLDPAAFAALAALPRATPVNDGFVFSVRTSQGTAVTGEGDTNDRRADLLDAAAAVVSACLPG